MNAVYELEKSFLNSSDSTVTSVSTVRLVEQYSTLLKELMLQGGPRPEQDAVLDHAFSSLYQDLQSGRLSLADLAQIRAVMNFTPDTMQGFSYLKPNGYAGCFETIDRIYQRYHTSNSHLWHWDRYWQSRPAAQAVRNRKDYFIKLVRAICQRKGSITILNVASGPCRDVLELLESTPDLPLTIHCVEKDNRAIAHALDLCKDHLANIVFHQADIFRFSPKQEFDLVWSAGLFDYLRDSLFIKLLKRLAKATKAGGALVVGNFAETNPSRAYMELLEWQLIHRSSDDLRRLASAAEFSHHQIDMQSEPLAVNLFLHLQKLPTTSMPK